MIARVLIIGYGSMGQRYVRLVRELLPECDLRILTRSLKNNKLPIEANGLFSELNEALAFTPQFAVIASPAPHHIESAIPLAKIGTHLLIEKPIAATTARVQELIDIANLKNLILSVGYNLRFLPSLCEFKRLIEVATIGRCYSVRAEVGQYLPTWRPNTDYKQGVSARKELGGGVLLELSHEIDYLRWIFGEIVSVQAILSTQSSLEIDVEDNADLMLEFVSMGEIPALTASVHLDFLRQDAVRTCTVIGERGTLQWNAISGDVNLYLSELGHWETVFRDRPQRDATYAVQLQHILHCIEHKQLPLTSGVDGLAAITVVEQARVSASKGCRVSTSLI